MLAFAPAKTPPCAAPEYHQFDFWIGDWDAFDVDKASTAVARNRVEPILGGCVLREDYRGADGSEGQSFSVYDAYRKIWHQTWVTNQGKLLVIDALKIEFVYPNESTKTMNRGAFLLLNVALAFYNAGTIWAHEVDIFRSWRLVDADAFHRIQTVHWRKLPYWVFLPVGLSFAGSNGLIWYCPAHSPAWAVWCAISCQVASHALTALLWGRWQARLSNDPLGPTSPYLARILSTHWIRTLLINSYGFILPVWAIDCLAR